MEIKEPTTIWGAIKRAIIWIILAIGGGMAYIIYDAAKDEADRDIPEENEPFDPKAGM